jgi:hypothetical protein
MAYVRKPVRNKVVNLGGSARGYTNRNYSTPVKVDSSELDRLGLQLSQLSREQLQSAFKAAHGEVAAYVFGLAVAKAQARRQSAVVARDSRIFSKSVNSGRYGVQGASITLKGGRFASRGLTSDNNPGDFAFGSEFGAKQNVVRRVKVTPGVIRAQGRIKKKPRGADSDLNFGAFRIMRGWNQFQPWRGGSNTKVGEGIEPGYFMFPAIVESRDTVQETYGQAALAEISKRLKG